MSSIFIKLKSKFLKLNKLHARTAAKGGCKKDPSKVEETEEVIPDLEKFVDEVHPVIFDESMKFGSEEDTVVDKSKAFNGTLLTDTLTYTGMKIKPKKEEPGNVKTPEPEKRMAPRPVFR